MIRSNCNYKYCQNVKTFSQVHFTCHWTDNCRFYNNLNANRVIIYPSLFPSEVITLIVTLLEVRVIFIRSDSNLKFLVSKLFWLRVKKKISESIHYPIDWRSRSRYSMKIKKCGLENAFHWKPIRINLFISHTNTHIYTHTHTRKHTLTHKFSFSSSLRYRDCGILNILTCKEIKND